MKLIINILALLFIAALLCFTAFSCKTIKEVVKVETRYDSTAIRENAALKRVLSEEIERFEKEKETWEKTGIVFETDCDTVTNTVTKIVYDNGKLKSIEGRVKTLNMDIVERTEELYDAHRQIDSLQYALEKEETNVKHHVKVLHRDVKRTVMPGWIWLLLAVGWIARGYWPRLKQYLSLIKP